MILPLKIGRPYGTVFIELYQALLPLIVVSIPALKAQLKVVDSNFAPSNIFLSFLFLITITGLNF
jgi:hypothetical protein